MHQISIANLESINKTVSRLWRSEKPDACGTVEQYPKKICVVGNNLKLHNWAILHGRYCQRNQLSRNDGDVDDS